MLDSGCARWTETKQIISGSDSQRTLLLYGDLVKQVLTAV